MASVKGYLETVVGTAVLLIVLGAWAGMAFTSGLVIGFLVGALFIGSVVYGLGWLYRKSGLRVGARGVVIYFAVMLVALAIRYLLFGAP